MKVTVQDIEMKVTHEEACLIYYALKRDILISIKEHYMYHPDNFERDSHPRFDFLRQIGPVIGRNAAGDISEMKEYFRGLVKAEQEKA